MTAHYTLVACVYQKREERTWARDLYVSTWFRHARRYAEQAMAPWAILSAKHHLLDPNTIVAPYNESLVGKSRDERRRWAATAAGLVIGRTRQGTTITILGGRRYTEFLVPLLAAADRRIELPLAGLGIGQQLHLLKLATEKPK